MPKIMVITTIKTFFDVPEGVDIQRVRHLALPDLSEMEDNTDAVTDQHGHVLNRIYLGDASVRSGSVEHAITEVIA
ncbi:hypothetical protein PSCICO_31660 [Pseudomonas cichorii]|uniref:hypothetical protein n=1 Tax=Pseudomonas cichorii TaxID=36746 RepID=UPI001910C17B|nr:hypothetical protein [Pseudomonas cichorii]GFM87767.1 hypothetical protein PSCICO_31660 [Pseudomonas cichorii]